MALITLPLLYHHHHYHHYHLFPSPLPLPPSPPGPTRTPVTKGRHQQQHSRDWHAAWHSSAHPTRGRATTRGYFYLSRSLHPPQGTNCKREVEFEEGCLSSGGGGDGGSGGSSRRVTGGGGGGRGEGRVGREARRKGGREAERRKREVDVDWQEHKFPTRDEKRDTERRRMRKRRKRK
ncbi:hypothetical protein E2C01_089144 [Portunus trituberculatus]|uniref:Uncharacterized protein n=1 Tax=Portunus trituberculatus TaxID=210409 RepID=A0A5B7JNS2_PORTR|nr:hypothetical protein [Portunus trituberculatus]